VAASLAIGQLNIDTGLLNQIVVTVLVTFGAAVAIALGMGGRDVAANVMAGIYLRALLETDREIECGDVEGTLVAITAVKSVVACGDERVTIPNRDLLNGITRIKAVTRRS
jgi:small-conductance mechanosensitive channel